MKTILKLTIILTAVFICNNCIAQNVHFVKSGVIEYEKRSNMYALIKKRINSRNESYMTQSFENYKKNFPQFKSAKSTLKFNSEKGLYKFNDEAAPTSNNWLNNNPIA
ncbi:MAG: GLPGLI family protein, partial [Pedobacter sp.]